MCIAETGN